jgi:hypothetical protein
MQLRTYVKVTLDPSLGEFILTDPDLKVVHMQKHALKKKVCNSSTYMLKALDKVTFASG